ncbi:hypothetical protein A1O1_08320 [Capronia coronata CBS 617.96]|uniref:Uncharacterized protein n=1 Tax=Capronia coronata CBS 617.96 TaxID=1182541 RepID=W9XIY0_9EURO|nr:uncharacterized protein A1O1_08320 [Capronia coronata CBS 617.96]EXJ80178.1 hypothetical protein A1O1_08320 [Capronia coronata CBS 617.96]
MSSRVGLPSKRPDPAEEDVECPYSPTSSSGSSCHQDMQQSSQGQAAQSSNNASTSSTRGGEEDHEEELSQRVNIPPCISKEEHRALSTAMPHPPVTKEGLEELDLEWITSNIRLRIDLNYDHNLEFMRDPGVRGELKRQEARKYWLSLEAELKIMYQHNFLPSCVECETQCSSTPMEPGFFKPRLPDMLYKLKDLLTALLPDSEHDQLAQCLDIPLLLQELSHGLMDIVRLAGWIRQRVTSHCAPYRDKAAHDMADQIRDGVERGDIGALVAGVESLFGLLEAMQLDVANHQVRNLRGSFIDDTVDFQRKYFGVRIENGHLTTRDSHRWWLVAFTDHGQNCVVLGETLNDPPFVSLIHGLVGLCLNQLAIIPETLKYDTSRLRMLSAEIQELVHVEICLVVFNKLVEQIRGSAGGNPGLMYGELRTRLMALTETDPALDTTVASCWKRHVNAVTLELMHSALRFCQKPDSTLTEDLAETTAKMLDEKFLYEARFRIVARAVGRALEECTYKYAKVYEGLPASTISYAQNRLRRRFQPPPGCRLLTDFGIMASRLAHIAVIHWRVWEDLVYLREDESDDDESEEDESVGDEDGDITAARGGDAE